MTMPCRITDEWAYNPAEMDANNEPERTIHDISIAELMGENHAVWLGKNKEFGFVLEIESDDGKTVIEKCIHPYAAESLAGFCRRYLNSYEKIEASQ